MAEPVLAAMLLAAKCTDSIGVLLLPDSNSAELRLLKKSSIM
jgi:hypothetical protein